MVSESDLEQPVSAAVDTDAVSRFVAGLDVISELPVAEHAEVYQQVHSRLQAALADIDGR